MKANNVILIAGFGFYLLAFAVVVLIPWLDPQTTSPQVAGVNGDVISVSQYSDLEKRGREVYIREVCWQCHSQQVRARRLADGKILSMGGDVERYGPATQAGEVYWDRPHLFGTRRIGPDLARVGGKYGNAWHYAHLKDPAAVVPGSIMPKFSWLFDAQGNPTEDAKALVAYLQRLGTTIGDWRAAEAPPAAQPAPTARPAVPPDSAQLRAKGKELFMANCAVCHGQTGKGDGPASGGIAANFTDEKWTYGGEPEQVFNTITKGTAKGMPPWGQRFSEEERWALTYYVLSFHENKREDEEDRGRRRGRR